MKPSFILSVHVKSIESLKERDEKPLHIPIYTKYGSEGLQFYYGHITSQYELGFYFL